jgi:hypothetical protein
MRRRIASQFRIGMSPAYERALNAPDVSPLAEGKTPE